MGKKRCRKTKTSKGQRPNVKRDTVKAVARDRPRTDYWLNKLDAWAKGQNPWITVKNEDGQTNRPFKRVRATDVWGKNRKPHNIFFKKEKKNV